MSAERHAMEAVLEYSKKLEKQIECLKRENSGLAEQLIELRKFVRDVKDVVDERDRPIHYANGPQYGAATQQRMSPDEAMCNKPEDCPRCKNCGCPV